MNSSSKFVFVTGLECLELKRKDHWMVGTQFHPEFKSRPYNPSPIYLDFIKACLIRKK